jgi:CRISPR-associated endonuclease/helicase Cas3
MSDRLLAKSQRVGEPWTDSMLLPNHLADVHRAGSQVLDATGDDQLTALGLSPAAWRDRLRRVVTLAAATHDLGKANDHFQGMLDRSRKDRPQGLRHEWVTLLILEQPEVREWLLPAVSGNDDDWQIALWAIAGHHPAYNRPSPPRLAVDGGGHELKVRYAHPDFTACLDFLARTFKTCNLGKRPSFERDEKLPLVGPSNVFAAAIQPRFRAADWRWRQGRRRSGRKNGASSPRSRTASSPPTWPAPPCRAKIWTRSAAPPGSARRSATGPWKENWKRCGSGSLANPRSCTTSRKPSANPRPR